MNHKYDLFEKFSDGSSLWRESVTGFETTRLRLRELAQGSENQLYAFDLTTGEILAFNTGRGAHGFHEPSQTESLGCFRATTSAPRHKFPLTPSKGRHPHADRMRTPPSFR
jgi:hypothetical protein